MIAGAWFALLAVTGSAGAAPVLFAQLTIRQQIIIRIPTRPHNPDPPVRWREKKGPKCIPAQALAGAIVNGNDVDLLLRGGERMRAKLESGCPALDYYSGFYIRPGSDGKICQDRDSIRARSGGSCQIGKFRKLVPDKHR